MRRTGIYGGGLGKPAKKKSAVAKPKRAKSPAKFKVFKKPKKTK